MLHASSVCVGVASVLLIAAVTCKTDYCELCSPKMIHTMCKYPKPGPGKGCDPYTVHNHPLTFVEKKRLVHIHNKLRNTVAQGNETEGDPGPQPSAKNMRLMSWDEELEIIATRWADQCQIYKTDKPHDECRDSERFAVGQNIATETQDDATLLEPAGLAETWFIDEVIHFNSSWVHSYLGEVNHDAKIGHYTQLLWADSYLVGCGRVVFEEKDDKFVIRLVCNYGPGGNIIRMPLYKVGKPCSECPDNSACNHTSYPALCATPQQLLEKDTGGVQPNQPLKPNSTEEENKEDEDNDAGKKHGVRRRRGMWMQGFCLCPSPIRSCATSFGSISLYFCCFGIVSFLKSVKITVV